MRLDNFVEIFPILCFYFLLTYASPLTSSAYLLNGGHPTGAKGASLGVPKTTSFIVAPRDDSSGKFVTSREALLRVMKLSDFNLKVKILSSARNNDVRIEAFVNLQRF